MLDTINSVAHCVRGAFAIALISIVLLAGGVRNGSASTAPVNAPVITSISPITTQKDQRIVIKGRGFGNQRPFRGDSTAFLLSDLTRNWNAGCVLWQGSGTASSAAVTVNVAQWTNVKIVITGFGGYGGGYKLADGDRVEIVVWNAQAPQSELTRQSGPSRYVGAGRQMLTRSSCAIGRGTVGGGAFSFTEFRAPGAVDNDSTKTPSATGRVSPPHLANGIYTLRNQKSNLLLDNPEKARAADVQKLDQRSSNGSDQQKWKFTYQHRGWYTIQNVFSGMNLQSPAGHTWPGAKLQQAAPDGAKNELWKLIPRGDGFVLVNAYSWLVVDDTGASTAENNPIDLWTLDAHSNQDWIPVRVASGVRSLIAPVQAGRLRSNEPVNLLKLVNVKRDTVHGQWLFHASALECSRGHLDRIVLPYKPPAEYDYKVRFLRLTGNDCVVMFCSAGGNEFDWVMGGWGNKFDGFEEINGNDANNNPTSRRYDSCLQNRRDYTCLIKVRRNGVRAYLNGKLVSMWKTNYNDMSLRPGWRLPRNNVLGLGSQLGDTIFYSAELIPVIRKPSNQNFELVAPPSDATDMTLGPLLPISPNNPEEFITPSNRRSEKLTSPSTTKALGAYLLAKSVASRAFEKAKAHATKVCKIALQSALRRAMVSGAVAQTRLIAVIITAMDQPSFQAATQPGLTSHAAKIAWRQYRMALAKARGNYLFALHALRLTYTGALKNALSKAIQSGNFTEARRIHRILTILKREDANPLTSNRSYW